MTDFYVADNVRPLRLYQIPVDLSPVRQVLSRAGKKAKLPKNPIKFISAFTSIMMYIIIIVNSPRTWHVMYFEDSKGYSQVFEFIENRK
ncbi:MAG: hypothetical protein JW863_04835, partial [Chitinispirillaceae bacterium]|nr:hypothetical protein [Chitinispirillaceae bacterium]